MLHDLDAIRDANPLSTFIGGRLKLKREGHEWVALCPFHQEKTPSFKVNDQKGLFYCFGCAENGDIFDFVQKYHHCDFPTACDYLAGGKPAPTDKPILKLVKPAIEPLRSAPVPDDHILFEDGDPLTAWKPEDNRTITYRPDSVWAYTDLAGALTSYVIRINFDNGKKIFVPLRPVYRGDEIVWATAHPDTPRPLYGLERLVQPGAVFVCEGEKSADACQKLLGLPSLSAPKGSVDYAPLAGRDVTVWADADEAGQKHAERVASALLPIARAVRIVPWDTSRGQGWDAANAFAEKMTRDEAMEWFDQTATELAEPIPDPDLPAPIGGFGLTGFDGDIPPPRPWAYGDFLMEGAVTGVPSPPGTGKTTFAMQLAIAFALDRDFGPWKPRPGGGGKVWVLNGEEPKEELDRRFVAAAMEEGIDPSLVRGRMFYNSALDDQDAVRLVTYDRATDKTLPTPAIDRIKATVLANDIKLLVLDPLIEFHNVKETDTEQFQALGVALREIARDTGCALLAFHHTPKAATSDNSAGEMAAMRGAGSMLGVMRFVVTMFRMSKSDADESGVAQNERHQFVRIDGGKANMGPLDGGEHWFRLVGIGIDNAAGVRPADSVAALRYAPMKAADNTERKRSEATHVRAGQLSRIASEIVRVCLLNGWTGADRAASMNTVCGALDRIKTGLAPRGVTDMLTGFGEDLGRTDGHYIHFVEQQRAANTYRRVYISEAG